MVLHPYQRLVVSDVLERQRAALFLDMGLGKTAIILNVISELVFRDSSLKILFIAPKALTLCTLPNECDKFTPQLRYYNDINRVQVPPEHRHKLLAAHKNHHVLFLSYSLAMSFFEHNLHLAYRGLVIDESTKFKGYKNKTFRCLKKNLSNFTYRYIMTGTPIPNGYMDLYNQISILDDGERLGSSFYEFRKKYYIQHPYLRYEYVLKDGAEDEIKKLTKDLIICRTTKELPDELPQFISTVKCCPLEPKHKSDYKRLKRDFILSLTADPADPRGQASQGLVLAKSQAELTNKLLQYCSGAVYTEVLDKGYVHVHDTKLDMLDEILQDYKDRILLAYNYKHEAERILLRFPDDVFKYDSAKPEQIAEWEAGTLPRVLMAHPESVGYGLNLQYACNMIIWFGFTWRLEQYLQFNKRLHRQGQQHPVYCVHLAVEDIEYKLLDRLQAKGTTQQSLLNYMRTCCTESVSPGFLC